MSMPMLPGLNETPADTATPTGNGGEEAADGIAAVLESIDEETWATLVSEADEAYLDGALDEYMDAPAADGDAGQEEDEEEEAPPSSSSPDAAPAPEDQTADVAVTDASAMVEEIAQMQTELDKLVIMAKDSDEGDPKPIEAALDTVSEALADAEEALAAVESAADSGDNIPAATAKATVEGAHTKATAACNAAKEAAANMVAAAREAEAADAPEQSALAAWADANA